MDSCYESRSLLFRVAEGEADPEEALRVARHLPGCTTCRILLAREIRLARVLESLDDAIPVEDGFLDEVMRALPDKPARAALRVRRGLKLAGLAGTLLLGATGAARLTQIAATPEMGSRLAGTARMALTLADRVSAGLVLDLSSIQLGPTSILAAIIPGAIAIAALTTFFAVVARVEPRG